MPFFRRSALTGAERAKLSRARGSAGFSGSATSIGSAASTGGTADWSLAPESTDGGAAGLSSLVFLTFLGLGAYAHGKCV